MEVRTVPENTGNLYDYLDGIIPEELRTIQVKNLPPPYLFLHRLSRMDRDTVETWGQFILKGKSSGNEQKRFRSTVRACNLGEQGNLSPCRNEACWMCEAIWCGFQPHLRRKQRVPQYVSIFLSVDTPSAVFLIAMRLAMLAAYGSARVFIPAARLPSQHSSSFFQKPRYGS